MKHSLKIEKIFHVPAEVLYEAIGKGRLFFNCGADARASKIDFRLGGSYQIYFKGHGLTNKGEFLELVPNQRIVFSWCQEYEEDAKPDTKVTIELAKQGDKTKLTLTHEGFEDKENCNNHQEGWTSGSTDLAQELSHGILRMIRVYSLSRKDLYQCFLNKKLFQEFPKGFDLGARLSEKEGLELSYKTSLGALTLRFDDEDEGQSSVEILHEGIKDLATSSAYRESWERLTEKLKS